jgi:hypothetical protein
MQELLAIIQAVRAIAPVIPEAIQIAEALCPAGSQGAIKLKMAQDFVQGAYIQLGNASTTFESMLPTITTAINGAVAAYNAAGVFRKQ